MRILYANAYFCFIKKKNDDNKVKMKFSIQIYNLMKNSEFAQWTKTHGPNRRTTAV